MGLESRSESRIRIRMKCFIGQWVALIWSVKEHISDQTQLVFRDGCMRMNSVV